MGRWEAINVEGPGYEASVICAIFGPLLMEQLDVPSRQKWGVWHNMIWSAPQSTGVTCDVTRCATWYCMFVTNGVLFLSLTLPYAHSNLTPTQWLNHFLKTPTASTSNLVPAPLPYWDDPTATTLQLNGAHLRYSFIAALFSMTALNNCIHTLLKQKAYVYQQLTQCLCACKYTAMY